MSLWTRIADAISAYRSGENLSSVFEKLRSPPERSVAFTIAVIALSAKMAKADGLVTRDEVTAFREVFTIAPADEPHAAKVFNLARQDVTGFEIYASRIAEMFADDPDTLTDLMEGLFHIAMADGTYHPAENAFLAEVGEIFGLSETCFRRLRAQHVPDAVPDPYDILGIAPDAPLAEARKAWRALVRETHPDRMMARGVPEEAVKLAERKLIAINRAWEEIQQVKSA
ncbi:heat shock protein DnaJ domain protein [Dinoroseobacter shibae DFL 12 = DSM 16493]|jgi:DnaJ like chaperone protein|uniref:Heat shock protein DnaJ domain protein n=1 Tax=Dinoroseobacter shibae (strain DSM 16493 / NCIMB 14021 / DFL 12) TaxID=398580 RepID=A8LQT9_DINSH|nr:MULTISPECIES: molecular chaperone DjiA [Dinoroseobacter]ABV92482.1 heat shock protein DnaJ domain protein [Dinoroseobacter shibae DFL 12 = DSM 16493]MDD9718257.1 molecular chaperone DjiA [Dinoroseobacter sp. PD6]URF47426.1 molecular chaperone DjiA [Dinoroseobacter shibae]URF51737.1 molecular chaperone DjiA [Dinoroseobacter shibae]